MAASEWERCPILLSVGGRRWRGAQGVRSVTLLAMPPRERDTARHLRRNPTEAEALLWQALRARRLDGYKFRRQYPVAGFIADFCCPSARLIVELDGGVHRSRRSADAARDKILQHHGYRILHISNDSVLHDLEVVQDRIRRALILPPTDPLSIASRWRGGQGVRLEDPRTNKLLMSLAPLEKV